MAHVEETIAAAFSGAAMLVAAVTGPKGPRLGLVGQMPDDGIAAPALSYQRISLAETTADLDGDGDFDQVRMQVDAWGTTAKEAADLAAMARDVIAPAGSPGLGTMQNWEGPTLDLDDRTWRVRTDYFIWHERS